MSTFRDNQQARPATWRSLLTLERLRLIILAILVLLFVVFLVENGRTVRVTYVSGE
jgi:uncharacterized integral membrane protein